MDVAAQCPTQYLSIVRVSKVSDGDHKNVHQSSYDVKSTPPTLCNTICDHVSKCLSSLRKCIREREESRRMHGTTATVR